MKKCVIVYNNKSGSKHIDVSEFHGILEKYEYEVEIIETEYAGHAQKIVEDLNSSIDLVISAGGDGTYNEVITGNLNRKKPLLIANLPIGTTNDVATMFGYSKSTLKNLDLLLSGIVKKVDIPTINGKVFTYVASFGNYMNIAYDTPRELKERYGRMGYFIYGLRAIQDKLKLFDITYEIEGTECSGRYSLIFVTNSTHIGGMGHIFKDVKLDDGDFEIVLCNLTSKQDLVKNLCFFPIKHIEDIPGFTVYRANHFRMKIQNRQDTSWCIDGEKLVSEESIYDLTICNKMKLLVPDVYVEELFVNQEEY